jgi:cyclopropane-fatty-acyl-phospholipid synthase
LGLTVSNEQQSFATKWTRDLPVEIQTRDYREARGEFDAVVSIGLMEHIGPKNYRTYMELVDRCLSPGGTALIHTIAGNRAIKHMEPWFEKYIFPNAVLPTIGALGASIDDLFVCEDVHNIGPDYDKTLLAWNDNFNASWDELHASIPTKYDQRFYRMWTYYLLCSAAGFRARYTQLFQMVFTRPGTPQPKSRLS